MRHIAPIVVVLLVGPLVGAPVPKSIKARDEDFIVGSWQMEKLNLGRVEHSAWSDLPQRRYVFRKAGGYSETSVRSGTYDGSFKLGSDGDLKTLDITINDGTAPGLYELGGDTLRICWSESNTIRPAEFKAEKGVSYVITYKRVKDEKKEEKKDK